MRRGGALPMPAPARPISRAAAAAALLVTACGEGASELSHGAAVRDSAGIRIVESHEPAWGEGEGWVVDSVPEVVIGAVDGAPEYEFGAIRGALRLPDGRIVVGDEMAAEVRFYDPAGRFLHAVGGRGEGPGEFVSMWSPEPFPGDSIWVFDYIQRRVTILDGEGRLGRTVPVTVPGNAWASGLLGDGRFLVYSPGPNMQVPVSTEVLWDSTDVLRYGGPDVPPDTIGRFPLREVRGRSTTGPRTWFFPASISFTTAGGRLYLGWTHRYEIRVLDGDGETLALIRRALDPEPATRAMVEEYRAFQLERMASDPHHPPNEAAVQRLEEAEHRDTLPFFSSIEVDAEGYVWVRDYAMPLMERSTTWSVFHPDGHWLGEVELPPGLEVSRIGRDFVLGTAEDELGVSYVHLHQLRR
jgi:hypothetical protein